MTVLVTPEHVGYGGAVAITGATAADLRSKNRTVTLRFAPPGGAPFSRKTELDGEMRYRYELSPLLAAGEWDVTVTGPVKELGRATARFVVMASGAFYETARLGYRYCAVQWSPYHIVPTVDFPAMDVPGAEWFFTRVTGTAGEKKTFSLPLVVDGDTVIVEHTFDRVMDYVREREFKATLVWEIKGKETGI